MVDTFNKKTKHIDDTLQFRSTELMKKKIFFVKEVRERAKNLRNICSIDLC